MIYERSLLGFGSALNRWHGVRSPTEWQEAAAWCIAEMDAVLETFGALLRIAQIENGAAIHHFGEIDLSDVLRTMAEVYAPMADEKGQSFTAQIPCGLPVWGDRELVSQMLANVIENAMKHSPRGAKIGLMTTACPTEIKVAVLIAVREYRRASAGMSSRAFIDSRAAVVRRGAGSALASSRRSPNCTASGSTSPITTGLRLTLCFYLFAVG